VNMRSHEWNGWQLTCVDKSPPLDAVAVAAAICSRHHWHQAASTRALVRMQWAQERRRPVCRAHSKPNGAAFSWHAQPTSPEQRLQLIIVGRRHSMLRVRAAFPWLVCASLLMNVSSTHCTQTPLQLLSFRHWMQVTTCGHSHHHLDVRRARALPLFFAVSGGKLKSDLG
jgi:hypothetical protein